MNTEQCVLCGEALGPELSVRRAQGRAHMRCASACGICGKDARTHDSRACGRGGPGSMAVVADPAPARLIPRRRSTLAEILVWLSLRGGDLAFEDGSIVILVAGSAGSTAESRGTQRGADEDMARGKLIATVSMCNRCDLQGHDGTECTRCARRAPAVPVLVDDTVDYGTIWVSHKADTRPRHGAQVPAAWLTAGPRPIDFNRRDRRRAARGWAALCRRLTCPPAVATPSPDVSRWLYTGPPPPPAADATPEEIGAYNRAQRARARAEPPLPGMQDEGDDAPSTIDALEDRMTDDRDPMNFGPTGIYLGKPGCQVDGCSKPAVYDGDGNRLTPSWHMVGYCRFHAETNLLSDLAQGRKPVQPKDP